MELWASPLSSGVRTGAGNGSDARVGEERWGQRAKYQAWEYPSFRAEKTEELEKKIASR